MNILKHSIVFAFVVFALLGCRRKLEDPPIFPAAEYFSPTVINNSSAEIEIHGINLDETTVLIGGKEATQVSLTNENKVLTIKIPEGLQEGRYKMLITLNDGEVVEFATPVVYDKSVSNLKEELLLGDFDGAGIRAANTTRNFSDGAWLGDPGANSVAGITNELAGVQPSPAGGNFVYLNVPAGGILPNTYGYVAALISRNEIQNDLLNAWPKSFLDYPNSSLTLNETFDGINDYYLNFYLNFNGYDKGKVRVYLGNSDLQDISKYAYDILAKTGDNKDGWKLYSIKLGSFGQNWATTPKLTIESLQEINQVSFSVSDNFENNYKAGCCVGASIDCCTDKGVMDHTVEVYIDQVVLTKGAPAYDYSTN